MLATAESAVSDGIFIASNESVYGPGEKAQAAIVQSASRVERYPEDGTRRLAGAIGTRFSLDPDKICCGFGSDDLLARIARAYLSPGDELVYPRHGYPKIANYAHANDAVPVGAGDSHFAPDIDAILNSITERTRIVMLANPDNPAGTYVGDSEIRRLHGGLPSDVLLVLDSAYAEYVAAEDYEDPARLVDESSNVVMTRTFSKVFGLAGLRIGWLFGPHHIVDSLTRIGITFPISVTALAACEAALEDRIHFEHVVRENGRVRESFRCRLGTLGIEAIPSQTNFVLVRFADDQEALSAQTFLEEHGVFARRLAAGGFSRCIRFTMGTEAEMNTCVEVLDAWVTGRG